MLHAYIIIKSNAQTTALAFDYGKGMGKVDENKVLLSLATINILICNLPTNDNLPVS